MLRSDPGAVAAEFSLLARSGLNFDDFATAASDAIRRAVPYDAMCMGTVDPSTNLLTSSRKIDMGSIGDEEFLFHEYAVHDIAHATEHLLADLVSTAPPKDRDEEAAKARARSAKRFASA